MRIIRTAINFKVGPRVSAAVWSHFLEHQLKDGRLETGQFVARQTDPGAVAVTVSFMLLVGRYMCTSMTLVDASADILTFECTRCDGCQLIIPQSQIPNRIGGVCEVECTRFDRCDEVGVEHNGLKLWK